VTVEMHREIEKLSSENVLGFIEGTDKKDEIVILTAHYDHIGIDLKNNEVYNGADDDGSGTVAIMEIAEAFAKAKAEGKGPRRSVLIMPVAGEEKGLLGSEYYSENPVYPLANTVVDLNIDMIGRLDKKHAGDPNYVYIIGSTMLSKELHEVNEAANSTYTKLDLDYEFNTIDDPNRYYYRSDHYNFAKKGVPVIFYFNGVHADYHKPTDTVDKINFDKMETITRLVFYTAWQLANKEKRIEVDVEPVKE
jgi:Zn-dependent M28 family amino/carboxypeptidase